MAAADRPEAAAALQQTQDRSVSSCHSILHGAGSPHQCHPALKKSSTTCSGQHTWAQTLQTGRDLASNLTPVFIPSAADRPH